MFRVALAICFLLHAAIHLFGFVKAFGLAELTQLKTPTTRVIGSAWLVAALGLAFASILFAVGSRHWWWVAAPAVVVSQLCIATSWGDAKTGTLPNLLLVMMVFIALLDVRASSLPSVFKSESERALSVPMDHLGPITEAQLAPLPGLVQTYLRRVGVVGAPRVHNFRARFAGQFKGKTGAGWMSARAQQVSSFATDRLSPSAPSPPSRLFFMEAALFGVPFAALHVFVGKEASMRVRALSFIEVIDARGPELNQSETVTIFNDLCVLAPGALVDAAVQWTPVDEHTVRGTYTRAGISIAAELTFDSVGDLVGFVSHDRFLSADGETFRKLPWSTPVGDYRTFGRARLAQRGVAKWLAPEGEIEYGRFELQSIEYNVSPTLASR